MILHLFEQEFDTGLQRCLFQARQKLDKEMAFRMQQSNRHQTEMERQSNSSPTAYELEPIGKNAKFRLCLSSKQTRVKLGSDSGQTLIKLNLNNSNSTACEKLADSLTTTVQIPDQIQSLCRQTLSYNRTIS